ncbi:MAG: hypothetical protein OIF55_12535 [Amphritea sp.]|nr:hypothetical protein [Amphritea sp.]
MKRAEWLHPVWRGLLLLSISLHSNAGEWQNEQFIGRFIAETPPLQTDLIDRISVICETQQPEKLFLRLTLNQMPVDRLYTGLRDTRLTIDGTSYKVQLTPDDSAAGYLRSESHLSKQLINALKAGYNLHLSLSEGEARSSLKHSRRTITHVEQQCQQALSRS